MSSFGGFMRAALGAKKAKQPRSYPKGKKGAAKPLQRGGTRR